MNGLPLLPAIAIDLGGSALAIVLSFLALRYALALARLQPNNFIWGFLFYFCAAMAVFSLSRGVGHIVRILLVYGGRSDLWQLLSPFSGGINSMLMISAAAVTIYYHKGLAAYKALDREAEKLVLANAKLSTSALELQRLNAHLEEMVAERTRDLSESEQKFRNFFENSKDIIYFCDRGGAITSLNTSGRTLLGVDPSAGQVNFHELFVDAGTLEAYLAQLRTNGYISDMEMECRCQDGTTRHLLLTARAISGQNGEIGGYEGIAKDMTRLKTMTEQLINHEKMASVGQMAAGVAHEINTPLGIILGYAQLMMDDYAKDSEAHENMEVIERQTKACRRIVADLLKFSRQAESVKSTIDINRIIEEVLAVTEHTLNINNIAVRRDFAQGLPQIFGNTEKLHQVFINLFNNSQHAMPEGGEIVITTTAAEGCIDITVADDGSGIADAIKNKIFDPFFTTKEVGKGTGLGLSVTYGIIQEHGGTISVDSPLFEAGEGDSRQGTAFHIRLPAASTIDYNQEEKLHG